MFHHIPRPPATRTRRRLIAAGSVGALVAGLVLSLPSTAGAASDADSASASVAAATTMAAAGASITDLKVNANPDALGIADPTPTLSWSLTASARGVTQTKYRIGVATTAAKATNGQPDVWDTGIVTSSSTAVDYAGPTLQPRTRYYWAVRAYTPTAGTWSSADYFETSYLDESQWQGSWISGTARSIAPVVAAEGIGDDACCVVTTMGTTKATAIGESNLKVPNVLGLVVGQTLTVGVDADAETVAISAIGSATLPATTLVSPTAVGATTVKVSQVYGFAPGRQFELGAGAAQETVTVSSVGTAQGAATTLAVAAAAGATSLKVNSTSGFVVGEMATVGTGAAEQVGTVTAVGTQARTTTLLNGAAAGDTNIKVAAITGLTNGDAITVDGEAATIATIGTAGASTTLSAAAAIGDTVVRTASVNGYTVGQQVRVGSEIRTVTVVGTAGAAGTGITLDAALTAAVATGTAVVRFGTGITLTAPLTAAHATATSVFFAGTGITLAGAITAAQAVGTTTRGLGSGITLTGPTTSAHVSGDPLTSLGSGLTVTPALAKVHAIGTAVVTTPVDICRPVGNSQNAGACKPVRPNFLLRKNFDVAPISEHGAVVSARLYSTGLGWSEPSINGALTQPGGHLNPGFNDYQDTVQYTTDDVTALIQQNATAVTTNVVASEVAAGRYNSESVPSNHRFETAQWRNQETLRADLYVKYADGTEQLVKSDTSWKVTTDGPTRYADYDNGETFDARRMIAGWNTAAHDVSAWPTARVVNGPEGDLIPQDQEATRVTKNLQGPFQTYTTAAGAKVFNVGRQIAGWATVKVWGAQAGQIIRVVYVERRNDDLAIDDPTTPGTGQDGALQLAGSLQQHYYVSDGTGTEANPEVFAPNWNFAGFQWVQIDGSNGTLLPAGVNVDVASVQQIMTALPEVGTFESSSPLINQIHTNLKGTIEGNWIAGFSSDTPTYEKDGWTGDAQIILPTVANLFNIQRSMQKSSRDAVDSQLANGQVGLLIPGAEGYGYCSPTSPLSPNVYVPCGTTPSLAVFKASGGGATPIWDAFLMVTSAEAWLRYADLTPIETAYGAMTRYMDDNLQGGKPYSQGPGGWFLWDGNLQNGEPDWTLTSGLGDWAFVTGANGNAAEGTNLNVGGFQAASSTAFTAYLATKTAEAARLLYAKTGNSQYLADAGKYETLFDNIREDFNARWWDAERGFYAENATQELRQGFQAWAIGFGLVEPENRRALQEKLAYDVAVTRTGHAMIGFVGIRWIWPVLSDAAHEGVPYAKEALFAVAQQTTYPSYGYHIGLGFTGIGEYWEASTRTRNHQFQGSIGQWFYEELAGIQPAAPGYKEIRIRPLMGNEFGVDHAAATYQSIHGEIASSWEDHGDEGLTLDVTIPVNTTAEIHVPGTDSALVVESGSGTEYTAEDAPGVSLVGVVDDAVVYEVGSGTYSFSVQPAAAVSFVDVPATHQFFDAIQWMADEGIANGTQVGGDTFFYPNQNVSRQANAAFLYRAAGSPVFTPPTTSTFSDVPTTATFYKEIEWMAAEGLSTGTPVTGGKPLFKPGGTLDRQSAVTFLWRLAGSPVVAGTGNPFPDVPSTNQFVTAIRWAASPGVAITTGYSDGTFRPGAVLNRQTAAAFLYRWSNLT